ncbi:MAG: hypothetical protein WCP98_22795, partial [Actinomycetes bacterium]
MRFSRTCASRAAASARVDGLDIKPGAGRYGLCRVKEAADRSHQPPQRLTVHLIGAPEAVDDPGHRTVRP